MPHRWLICSVSESYYSGTALKLATAFNRSPVYFGLKKNNSLHTFLFLLSWKIFPFCLSPACLSFFLLFFLDLPLILKAPPSTVGRFWTQCGLHIFPTGDLLLFPHTNFSPSLSLSLSLCMPFQLFVHPSFFHYCCVSLLKFFFTSSTLPVPLFLTAPSVFFRSRSFIHTLLLSFFPLFVCILPCLWSEYWSSCKAHPVQPYTNTTSLYQRLNPWILIQCAVAGHVHATCVFLAFCVLLVVCVLVFVSFLLHRAELVHTKKVPPLFFTVIYHS